MLGAGVSLGALGTGTAKVASSRVVYESELIAVTGVS
jgi:hypothetical protein